MKKTNFFTIVMFVLMIVFVVIFSSCKNSGKETDKLTKPTHESPSKTVTENVTKAEKEASAETKTQPATEAGKPTEAESTENKELPPEFLSDTLFIGDSRTVGLMEYAGLDKANFFCGTGMSVFNIKKNRISVPSVGKLTLDELLSNKKYGKIYVMLGINELGYDFQSIMKKYGELIDYIAEKQPDAKIFIQANLHVSKKRSDSDKYINNKSINKLNSELSKLADSKNIYYMDGNRLFDDKDGNLSADKTSDNAHLYAKYYVEWGKWICQETAKII